jgi:hypothetical protein
MEIERRGEVEKCASHDGFIVSRIMAREKIRKTSEC